MDHIDKLIEGFGRFRKTHYGGQPDVFRRLVKAGQSPRTLIIGCCDSRVDPAIITDCDPGDLFVIRNVANLVPPFETGGNYHGTSAALEFGVRRLEVQHIIVLGHTHCGGIRALMENPGEHPEDSPFVASWMQVAGHARNRVLARARDLDAETLARACEQEAIRVSLDNLLTFPWILERVARGTLTLHGWHFDLEAGELSSWDPQDPAGTRGWQPIRPA